MRRRTLLKVAGGAATLSGMSTIGAAEVDVTIDGGEHEYEGTRVYEYEPDGYYFQLTEKFESDKLVPKIGREVITISEEAVARSDLPREYRYRQSAFTIEWEDTAVLATLDEFRQQEREIKQQVMASSQQTPQGYTKTPLYSYDSTSANLSERTGPISIVWDTFRDADAIRHEMQNLNVWKGRCWCSALPSSERYAVIEDRGTPSQDTGFAKGTGVLGEQWHVRLWDLPDGRVVGQPHFDVSDHCHVTECNFKFDEARQTATTAFVDHVSPQDYSYQKTYAGNGRGYTDDDSADGWRNLITR